MTTYFIVPGLGNSDEEHWQSHFERSGENFIRINQSAWDAPDCDEWIATIDKAVQTKNLSDVVLIGHSLGCIAIAQWAKKYQRIIKGAMLVAPSDPEAPIYTFPSSGFNTVPLNQINFPTIVVTSADDVWVTTERAKYFAESWGSDFINIGNAGHINTAAGFGHWPQGLQILQSFD